MVRRGYVDEVGEVIGAEDAQDAQQLMFAASVAGRAALGERAGAKPRALATPRSRRVRIEAAMRVRGQGGEARG